MPSTPETMKAITFKAPGDPSVLELVDVPVPALLTPHDILVKIKGSALNPVDYKLRHSQGQVNNVLGFDASGIVVEASGSALFKQGDEVIFAGVLGRSGSNGQYAVVDSRIAGPKPKGWSDADAASLPLVGLTAWEMLQCHFNLVPFSRPKKEHTLLIVNGAGGVGTMATQLARYVFGIQNVVVTASRQETVDWAKKNGATHTISHREALAPQLEKLGLVPTLAFICFDTANNVKQLVPIMSPWGKIGSIVEATAPIEFDGGAAFGKALSFHWELMFARPLKNHDLEVQGEILTDLSKAVEQGLIKSMVWKKKLLSLSSLREMHALQESGTAYGKIAFEVGDTIE